MDENANPQGSENPEPINPEAAFEDYLTRQAAQAGAGGNEGKPAQGAGDGQPDAQANPDAAADADAQEQRFKVKVNGEEREIPLSELVKGYQLETDYRIKTSQVAEQARAAQAQFAQAQALQAHYAQQLQVYQQQLMQMRPAQPDPKLIDADPVSYLRQQEAWNNWQGQLQRSVQESQQLAAQQQQQRAQFVQRQLAEQAELLVKALPEMADPAKGKVIREELTQYLRKTGYSDAEIESAGDHRSLVMARKAMLYDQLQENAKQATQKVAPLPPKSPQRPGTGNVSPLDGRTRTMQALKRSGSIDDATNAFAALMGG